MQRQTVQGVQSVASSSSSAAPPPADDADDADAPDNTLRQWSGFQTATVAKRRRLQASAAHPASVEVEGATHPPEADADPEVIVDSTCHYSDSFHDGRAIPASFAVRMSSKNAQPKWRHVCVECCHWLQEDGLVSQIIDF